MWLISDDSCSKNVKSDVVLQLCSHLKSFRQFWTNIFLESSVLEKVGIAHSEVRKALVGNFTLVPTNGNGECALQGYANSLNILRRKIHIHVCRLYQQYPKEFPVCWMWTGGNVTTSLSGINQRI